MSITLDFPRARMAHHWGVEQAEKAAYCELITRFVDACRHSDFTTVQVIAATKTDGDRVVSCIKRHRPEVTTSLIVLDTKFILDAAAKDYPIITQIGTEYATYNEGMKAAKWSIREQIVALPKDADLNVVLINGPSLNLVVGELIHLLNNYQCAVMWEIEERYITITGHGHTARLLDTRDINYNRKEK